jgi:hypothetical protein
VVRNVVAATNGASSPGLARSPVETAAGSVRAAVATGFIASPGDDAPFVAATTFLTTRDDPSEAPSSQETTR